MKKNIGKSLALYPTPLVVVGTMVNGKPNYVLWDMWESSGMTGSWSALRNPITPIRGSRDKSADCEYCRRSYAEKSRPDRLCQRK